MLQSSVCFGELPVTIQGVQGGLNSAELQAHVHPFDTSTGTHSGLVTLTHPFVTFAPTLIPFLNPSFGNAMNQNVTFGGTPEVIFDGTDAGAWTSTAGLGTWNFADSGKVTITLALNLDSATWDDPTTTDMSTHTAITGKVDLDAYIPANNSMIVQFGLAGVALGNTVDLNDFINTGDFTEQSFVIPKEDLGIGELTVDEMTITMTRTGGARPTVKFDDFQIEETGSPVTFTLEPLQTQVFYISDIRIHFADNIASTLVNGTMPNLSYDDLMGITSPLTNGLVFSQVQDGVTVFSLSFNQLGDFLSAGFVIDNIISDGTNTFLTIIVRFKDPIVLDGQTDDFLSFTLNDDYSVFLQFTATASGSFEVTL